ncbi:MAG TPA: AbrB family transcriptional regulator, partial [Paenirhodobacter sp.]
MNDGSAPIVPAAKRSPDRAADTSARGTTSAARLRAAGGAALVLAAAAGGGWIASRLSVPLAWLTGALFISAVLAFAGVRAGRHVTRLRPFALIVLGLTLGQSFSSDILLMVLRYLPLITLCGVLTLAAGLVGVRLFTRIAGTDIRTAFFCAIPGGVVLMAVQAQRAGASEPDVVLSQTIRMIVIVIIYPTMVLSAAPGHVLPPALSLSHLSLPDTVSLALMGAYVLGGLLVAKIGQRTFIPNPWMLGPCLLAIGFAAFDWQPVTMPHELVILCQIVLGVSLGAQMTRSFVLRAHRL